MVLFNYATKEITIKVVYYGPGLCGKTTNLQYIHSKLNPKTRGKLISLSTETDRTLFFDFLPMEMGTIKGFKIRFQLYTVPGQVRYNATRKLVLKGSDGVVFVADSQRTLMGQNIESLENLKENLLLNGIEPDEIPLVFQYNKRDLEDITPVPELNNRLNYRGVPYFESVAIRGDGVLETFKEMTKILLKKMSEKHSAEVKEEMPPEEVTVRAETEDLYKPIPENIPGKEIHAEVQVGEGITEEITPQTIEVAEEETVGEAEYITSSEDLALEEKVTEEAGYPVEIETPSSREFSMVELEAPEEEAVEEKPLSYIPMEQMSEILNLLKEIKEGLDSLLKVLSDLGRAKEGVYKRIKENEEANRKKTEEILKSLNELKGKIDVLSERPEKKWFRLH